MNDIGYEIRELFDTVVDPVDVQSIVAASRRTGWTPWRIALSSAALALAVIGAVLLVNALRGPTNPAVTASHGAPYLGLDPAEWIISYAVESSTSCRSIEGTLRSIRYEPLDRGAVGPTRVDIHVSSHGALCVDPPPVDSSDLGPPPGPGFINDHGDITVLGQQARVFETNGDWLVLWLIGTTGTAELQIFGPDLGLEDAQAVVDSIIEMTAAEWEALVAATPEAETTTTTGPSNTDP